MSEPSETLDEVLRGYAAAITSLFAAVRELIETQDQILGELQSLSAEVAEMRQSIADLDGRPTRDS